MTELPTERFQQVGEVKFAGMLNSRLERTGDSLYRLTYVNAEYQQIRDVKVLTFTATPEDIDRLYAWLAAGFTDSGERQLALGNSVVSTRTMSGSLMIMVAGAGYFGLRKKDLDKLFGKQ